jgi:hypothetical protein
MMKLTILTALGALLWIALAEPSQAQTQCPIGTYAWVDSWGNQTCRRFSDGSDAVTRTPPNASCPNGSYPWTDSWGNRICRSYQQPNRPQTDYYDTSRGCPIGMYEWRDNWGNRVCRRYGQ